jgi:hypothetical protein
LAHHLEALVQTCRCLLLTPSTCRYSLSLDLFTAAGECATAAACERELRCAHLPPAMFARANCHTARPAITQAFTRRERATIVVANLKASVLGLYYMHRDW